MIRLSTIERLGELPTPARSSGTCPTPARIAWSAGRLAMSDPSIVIRPVQLPEPGDRLGQLGLPVARDRGDPDDLARHGRRARRRAGRAGRDRCCAETPLTDRTTRPRSTGARSSTSRTGRPTMSPARSARVVPSGSTSDAVTRPARMTVIRSAMARTSPSLWLMKTTLRAGRGHRPERDEQLLGLLGREDGRRLVHDQDPRPAVEHLEDLDPLLLADRELPDVGAGIDVEPDAPARSPRPRPRSCAGRAGSAAGPCRGARSRRRSATGPGRSAGGPSRRRGRSRRAVTGT